MDQEPISRIDVNELGAERDGQRQVLNKRLFMQLQVYGGCHDPERLAAELRACGLDGVLYQDINDPAGVGILGMSEDPAFFVTKRSEERRVGKECRL